MISLRWPGGGVRKLRVLGFLEAGAAEIVLESVFTGVALGLALKLCWRGCRRRRLFFRVGFAIRFLYRIILTGFIRLEK